MGMVGLWAVGLAEMAAVWAVTVMGVVGVSEMAAL